MLGKRSRSQAEEQQEDEDICWICLDSSVATDSTLGSFCGCPRPVHKLCLARWQLQQAGRKEEKYCRFCSKELPDWREALTPASCKDDFQDAVPLMVVYFEGRIHRIPARAGNQGLQEFKAEVTKLFSIESGTQTKLTFGCKEPIFGRMLKLGGDDAEELAAFNAAVHCARVSAAERIGRSRQGRAAAAASKAAQLTAVVDDGAAATATMPSASRPPAPIRVAVATHAEMPPQPLPLLPTSRDPTEMLNCTERSELTSQMQLQLDTCSPMPLRIAPSRRPSRPASSTCSTSSSSSSGGPLRKCSHTSAAADADICSRDNSARRVRHKPTSSSPLLTRALPTLTAPAETIPPPILHPSCSRHSQPGSPTIPVSSHQDAGMQAASINTSLPMSCCPYPALPCPSSQAMLLHQALLWAEQQQAVLSHLQAQLQVSSTQHLLQQPPCDGSSRSHQELLMMAGMLASAAIPSGPVMPPPPPLLACHIQPFAACSNSDAIPMRQQFSTCNRQSFTSNGDSMTVTAAAAGLSQSNTMQEPCFPCCSLALSPNPATTNTAANPTSEPYHMSSLVAPYGAAAGALLGLSSLAPELPAAAPAEMAIYGGCLPMVPAAPPLMWAPMPLLPPAWPALSASFMPTLSASTASGALVDASASGGAVLPTLPPHVPFLPLPLPMFSPFPDRSMAAAIRARSYSSSLCTTATAVSGDNTTDGLAFHGL